MSPTYYLVVRPEQINGKLAAHSGIIVLHLPNYTEVLVERPTIKDDALQVFEVIPPAGELRVVSDGGVDKHLLWKGDLIARSRPHEVVSVEVRTLTPAPEYNPTQAAQSAFGGYPVKVQLAAVAVQATPEIIKEFFGVADPSLVTKACEAILADYMKVSKGG